MILDLDLGNSFLKWRCGELNGRLPAASVVSAEWPDAWRGVRPQRVRLASVSDSTSVEKLDQLVTERWGLPLEQARTEARCAGVTNSYADPSRMGVDRWLAMLAGYARAGGACCVVDCGSAITVDLVADDGGHRGGFIMPGLHLMRVGLLGNTSQIDVRHQLVGDCEPGCSTEEAVANGLQLMLAGLAERVARDMGHWLGPNAELLVCGGDGRAFLHAAGRGELVPDLVLDGLALALPEGD